jgi:hypothetical protein
MGDVILALLPFACREPLPWTPGPQFPFRHRQVGNFVFCYRVDECASKRFLPWLDRGEHGIFSKATGRPL